MTPLSNLKYHLSTLETKEKQVQLASALKDTCTLPPEFLVKKMSCGSTNPPHEELQYYLRMGSILKRIIENPCGFSKIAIAYKTKKQDSVKPPKFKFMCNSLAKIMLKKLQEQGLASVNQKGYYASKKGKDLILEIYEAKTPNAQ